MGLPPTRANENHPHRHPRESGGAFSVRNTRDSRLRGNDVIFGEAVGTRNPALSLISDRDSSLRSE